MSSRPTAGEPAAAGLPGFMRLATVRTHASPRRVPRPDCGWLVARQGRADPVADLPRWGDLSGGRPGLIDGGPGGMLPWAPFQARVQVPGSASRWPTIPGRPQIKRISLADAAKEIRACRDVARPEARQLRQHGEGIPDLKAQAGLSAQMAYPLVTAGMCEAMAWEQRWCGLA